MATTTNQLYQTNILSAAGSAEVLGRGSNSYTDKWSYTTGLDKLTGGADSPARKWDKFDNFPTAVRTGNFVWVLHKIGTDDTSSGRNRAVWILADVVPDPSVDRQFGNNIAYPEIPDYVKYQFDFTSSNAAAYKASADTINTSTYDISVDGTPRYAFTVTDHKTTANDGENGNTQSHFHGSGSTSRVYKEIVYNGSNGGGFVTTNAAHVARLHGHGSAQYLLEGTVAGGDAAAFDPPITSYNYIYSLWPPFATKAQFETLYGTEAAWIFKSYSTDHDMLFAQAATETNRTIVYSGDDPTISYPFALPTFASNTKFKDIPGDTNGDGIDNTPSYEDTLTALAVVAAVVPGLDPTKCVGFPGDIKIPGIATDGISEKLKELKAAVASAASSAGLLDIEKRLEGFKDRIENSLPKGAQIQNLAADIANVNPDDFNVLDALNDKWKDVVDDVASYLDNILDLDICSLIGLEAKTGDDGSLVKKPELPSVPEKAIEVPEQSVYVPIPSKGTPQDEAQATTGYTPKKAEAAREKYNEAWKKVRDNGSYSILIENLETYQKDYDNLRNTPNYQKLLEFFNNKKDPLGLKDNLVDGVKEFEDNILPHLYAAKWVTKAVADAQKQITHKLLSTDSTVIVPGDNPLSYWTPHEILDIGSKYPDAIAARMNDIDYEYIDVTLKDKLLNEIEHQIFNEDILSTVEIIKTGMPSEYKSKDKEVNDNSSEKAGETGDPADDSIGQAIPEEFKSVTSGKVSYNYSKGTIRNKPIQPSLMKILEASAAEKNYSIVIYSGGQDYAGKGTRRIGGKRHDGGYAADVRVYNDKGRRIHAASTSSKDIAVLREFVLILLKNGIGSVGADSDYMNGNLHLDIAHSGPYKYSKACWGASGSSYRRIYAPQWLSSAFDNRV